MATRVDVPLLNRQPDEIIAFRRDGEVRVSQFVAEAIALSRQLPEHQYVINLHADRYQYLLGFCAAIIAGQCTLMPPNRQPHTLEQLAERYADLHIIGGSSDKDQQLRSEFEADIPLIAANQLCAIAFTSGSTGTPTAILKYWQTLRTGSLGNAKLLLADRSVRTNLLATVPPQHMWGLETSILLPLFANVAISHLTPFYPQDIVDALANLAEPRVLVSSPVHLQALLKSGLNAVSVDRIFTATAPLSKELASDLESGFATEVVDIFGCSEAGILARRSTSSEELWTLSHLFELIVRDDGIQIEAEHLTEVVLMPDIIELVDREHFRWIGRHQDMINIAGKRGSLADLNHRLREIPGVVDGVIFTPHADQSRLAALVVAPDLNTSDILRQLKEQIEPVFLPRPIFRVSELPRQETGKLATEAVNDLFELTKELALKAK
jgi:acyl-coenzyme A synthetase/AMP-(fatty) acid ligase